MSLQSGQVLAARYVLLRRLGDGRTAEVWLARDRVAGADRVIKVLREELRNVPQERAQFLRSARLQQQVRHPNVLRCTDVREDEPLLAVFEDAAHADVARLRGADVTRLVPVLDGVAAGVAALHSAGLVHRDLKAANVALADDGSPLVTDFGLAAEIGDAAAAAGGSPFTSSPAQLAGAPPAIADDVYSWGALAFELLSGYPPFYPDAEAARAAGTLPVPSPGRPDAPVALVELVRRCLSREPGERPRDLDEVRALMRALPLTAHESRPVVVDRPRPALRPPDSTPVIEPRWQKPEPPGPTASELRSQGFRRGLVAAALVALAGAAAFVFLGLPKWVEQRGDASPARGPVPVAKQPESTAVAAPRPDLASLAEQKRRFDELRPAVSQRLASLAGRNAGEWGGPGFANGKRLVAEADAAAGRREYAAGLQSLVQADASLRSVEDQAAVKLRAALAAGARALDAGDGAEARTQFEVARRIDPGNAAAKTGLRRVDTLDEVRGLLAEAAELERSGRNEEAAKAYRRAIDLDPETAAARSALARLQSEATSAAFGAAVAEALAATNRKDYVAARAAYERAGRLRPGSPEVRDGLAQVERAQGDRSIAAHLDAAQRAEREERWADALAEYRKALALDGNLLPAQQGVERAEPRAMLDAELASYLSRPERVFSSEMRGAARATLAQAGGVANPGPILSRQVAELRELVDAAERPVRIAIASDNLTEVTIYRVGRLGTFERRDMELLPGRYTVVGTRSGYRDVRRELTVLPGREPPSLVVRCEERI